MSRTLQAIRRAVRRATADVDSRTGQAITRLTRRSLERMLHVQDDAPPRTIRRRRPAETELPPSAAREQTQEQTRPRTVLRPGGYRKLIRRPGQLLDTSSTERPL